MLFWEANARTATLERRAACCSGSRGVVISDGDGADGDDGEEGKGHFGKSWERRGMHACA